MFRRETIIALRARTQAYRVAADLLHPELLVPPPEATPFTRAEPAAPAMSDEEIRAYLIRSRKRARFLGYVIFVAYMLLFAGLIAYIVVWNLRHPHP